MIVKHIGRETLSVTNVSIGVATTITSRMRYADMQILKAPARVTYDGSTAPVADTTGKLWTVSSERRVWGIELLKNIRFIRDTSTDLKVEIDYWGEP